jgi:hypothetical protein
LVAQKGETKLFVDCMMILSPWDRVKEQPCQYVGLILGIVFHVKIAQRLGLRGANRGGGEKEEEDTEHNSHPSVV